MLDDVQIKQWVNTAASGVRFGPDRRAVEEELREHIEDKMLDLQRIFPGMTEEEARKRALSGMGDPEELKISLAKVHRPWLGYLWMLTRVMACLALFFTAAYIVGQLLLIPFGMLDWEGRQVLFGIRETVWDQEVRERSVPLEPAEPVAIDGCLVTMKRVWLVEDAAPLPGLQPYEGLTLQAELLVWSPRFWIDDYAGLRTRLAAEDNLGNYYFSWREASDSPLADTPWDERDHWVESRKTPILEGSLALPHPFTRRYVFFVFDVNPAAEQLWLEYKAFSREFSMVVDLKEAGT